ncbi:MAG: hypothetical protein HYU02_01555 [Thaumarchaeota archaeon]|nr:hypothetical protein [Nitrososphaerota archaeon]
MTIVQLQQQPSSLRLDLGRVVRYFVYMAFINLAIAIVITTPIFLPRLRFPILLTEWPGIYIYIGYTAFLIGGVVGMLAWAVGYYLLWKAFKKDTCDKRILFSQLIITNIGVYVVSTFMFIGGYQGAFYAHEHFGAFVVGKLMEWTVIPSGIGIALSLLGNMFGLANVFFLFREKVPNPSS